MESIPLLEIQCLSFHFAPFQADFLAYAVHEACANGPFSETGGDYNPFFTNYVDSSGKVRVMIISHSHTKILKLISLSGRQAIQT